MVYNSIMSAAKQANCTLNPGAFTFSVTEAEMLTKFTNNSSLVQYYSQPTRQQSRAYELWHRDALPLPNICAMLGSPQNPLKEGTVMFVVVCLISFLFDPGCLAHADHTSSLR